MVVAATTGKHHLSGKAVTRKKSSAMGSTTAITGRKAALLYSFRILAVAAAKLQNYLSLMTNLKVEINWTYYYLL